VITGLMAATAAAAPAQAGPAAVTHAAAASAPSGTRLWSAQFHGLGLFSQPQAMAASPDGSAVFITGFTTVRSDHDRYATVGYNALTGAKLWRSIFHRGPALSNSIGQDVVSRDSAKVFVTGSAPGGSAVFVRGDLGIPGRFATIGYSAATGARLWARLFKGLGDSVSEAMVVSPDSSTVFITGDTFGRASSALGAVNPTTPEIMVTGTCGAPNNGQNYVTGAYRG